MGKTENDSKGQLHPEAGPEELREAPRFTFLIRSAKLMCDSREYLCIVRDVSESGVRLRLFHPVPLDERLELEISSGETFAIDRVWERENHAGFRFSHEIDLERFIAETGPFPKRPVRLRFDFPVMVSINGMHGAAILRDLSRNGARIETDLPLATGQTVTVTADGLPEKIASVCWRDSPGHGLVFQQSLTFECLALLAHRLQLSAPSPMPGQSRKTPHCHSCNSACPLLMVPDRRANFGHS